MGHDRSVHEPKPEVWRKVDKAAEGEVVGSAPHLDEQLGLKAIDFPRSMIVSFRNI
jgi:hypothetical protein